MNLIIGQKYNKSDFGIRGFVNMWSEITVCGELFTFFSMDRKYNNIIEDDGFVYESRRKYVLIPNGIETDLHWIHRVPAAAYS